MWSPCADIILRAAAASWCCAPIHSSLRTISRCQTAATKAGWISLRAGEAEPRTSNPLPVALAPVITSFPPLAMTRGVVNGVVNVLSLRIGCQPEARVGQKVALLMDSREAQAQPFAANTSTLDFQFADAPPAGGTPLLRLKVDGIESIAVNRGARPPAFFNHRITLPV
jgi:hypothetical protein